MPLVFLLFSTSPFPNPFLPPQNPYPQPPPNLCSSAWPGAPGSPQAVTGAGEGEGHPDGRDRVSHCNRVLGALGQPKNELLYFWPIAAVGGVGRGGVRCHTPFLFLPHPPYPLRCHSLRCHPLRSWAPLGARGETPAAGSAALPGAVGP